MSAREPSNERLDDIEGLTQHARRALAATGGGTLLIDGLPAAGPDGPRELEVLLYEDDGEPRFLCEAGSTMAQAAARRRDAVLEVSCCRRSGCRREVRFVGRLALLDTDDVEGLVVHVVGLELSAVQVRRPGIGGTDGVDGVELPLARYREAVPGTDEATADQPDRDAESLTVYAERVVRHTNHSHASALRAAAAELAGSIPELVIAAEICDLTDLGFTVHWIGVDGAHSCPVSFPRAARTPGDLAVLLRGSLSPS